MTKNGEQFKRTTHVKSIANGVQLQSIPQRNLDGGYQHQFYVAFIRSRNKREMKAKATRICQQQHTTNISQKGTANWRQGK